VPLAHGSASVNDDLTWGQVARLYEARWRAQVDPEHASSLISDVLRIFVDGWTLTDVHGHRLAWPDDIERAHMGDVVTLHRAIMKMLRDEGGVNLEDAKAPANPTDAGPVDGSSTPTTTRPPRTVSQRRRRS
jgi:hypothetical protein